MTATSHKEWRALAPDGVDVRYFEECGSTNSLAAEAGAGGLKMPTWFVAGAQNAGRGRRGNAWSSAKGNLYCSYLIQPEAKISDLATLPYLVALAVRDTFIALGCNPDSVQCKWPNDVLVNGRKTSGILIESSAGPALKCDFAVIGIGLNLRHYPVDAKFPATSLMDEIDRSIEAAAAFKTLAHTLEHRLNSWDPKSVAKMIGEWRDCAWGMGLRREIRTSDESFFAMLEGLDDTGGLLLRLDDGSTKKLYAGEVFGPPRQH